MKIAFVSENGFTGKVPEDFNNARTEFAWMHNLDAYHMPLKTALESPQRGFDLVVLIIPKKNGLFTFSFVEHLKTVGTEVAVMQEGSFWNFQDLGLSEQIWYSNEYALADYIFCHSESDALYYRGIYDKPVMVLQTAMIDYTIKNFEPIQTTGYTTIIGGNFCSWYGGFDSFMVAQTFDLDIYAPAMGRKKDGEEQLVNILPYMNWTDWMKELSNHRYAVHLMRTFGAGTFAMNCSYFKIPCIGYKGLDTQTILHPLLSVDIGDIVSAKKLAQRLKKDEQFYVECSNMTGELFNKYYSKEAWLSNFNDSFELITNHHINEN